MPLLLVIHHQNDSLIEIKAYFLLEVINFLDSLALSSGIFDFPLFTLIM